MWPRDYSRKVLFTIGHHRLPKTLRQQIAREAYSEADEFIADTIDQPELIASDPLEDGQICDAIHQSLRRQCVELDGSDRQYDEVGCSVDAAGFDEKERQTKEAWLDRRGIKMAEKRQPPRPERITNGYLTIGPLTRRLLNRMPG